ncbi:Ribonuclease P protein component 2 [uncultured archaeon]|nr:Ribonuclease P protein component 2 [uncultured archaeon]
MKPTKRFKQRYVSFVLSLDGAPPATGEAKSAIHEHFLSFFGESGVSSLAFKLIKYNEKDGKGIVRCERSRVDETIFCMACLNDWRGKKARMESISTSGTIRRVQ